LSGTDWSIEWRKPVAPDAWAMTYPAERVIVIDPRTPANEIDRVLADEAIHAASPASWRIRNDVVDRIARAVVVMLRAHGRVLE